MIDFLRIATRTGKHGVIEVYPNFIITKSKDLMIRGSDFYAIWLEERGLWSTEEQDALQLIDRELDIYANEHKQFLGDNVRVLHMWDSQSGKRFMKIIEPKYEILTDISEGGIKELQQIERVARVCYKSEDKITPDGESAKKLVGFLVKQGHEAMLEHSQLSVLFTCDRGVANELVRHRIASFAQESTRYCNYSKEKFGGELTFIWPSYIRGEQYCELNDSEVTIKSSFLEAMTYAEKDYKLMIANGMRPEQARCVLPLCLKTDIVVTANYREWRNIFKLRTPVAAHPQMRELMCPLLKELQNKIPVVFDDIYTYWPNDDQTGNESVEK